MSRDDDITRAEVVALSAQVGSLTQRVYQLEQTIESLKVAPAAPAPAPQPSTYVVPRRQPAAPAPVAPRPATPPPARSRPPVAPRPQLEPVNWSKLAEQAFAARTLAWAGGIATALGIALLFVLAASRGWVTPEMRVGLGVLVSLGLLAAAFDLDRRGWRADAILSAGGAGIAGLYADALGLDLDLPLHLRGAGPALRRRHRGARCRPGDPGQAGAAGHLRHRRRHAGTDAGGTRRHGGGSAVLLRDRLRRAAAVLALPVDVAAVVDLGRLPSSRWRRST